jgi:hypothetical protein
MTNAGILTVSELARMVTLDRFAPWSTLHIADVSSSVPNLAQQFPLDCCTFGCWMRTMDYPTMRRDRRYPLRCRKPWTGEKTKQCDVYVMAHNMGVSDVCKSSLILYIL